jgi:acetyltransferase
MASLPLTRNHYLQPLFEPRSVAVVGATETAGKAGRYLLENLFRQGFTGELHLLNPKRESVLSRPCKASFSDLPPGIDLALIVTPPDTIAGILDDGGRHGLRSAVVLSQGFAASDPSGKKRLEKIMRVARQHRIRMLGPHSLGFMRTTVGLDASLAPTPARPGRLSLVSQSAAICSAILDWAAASGIGFASVVSLGEASDIDFGEVLDYLVFDEETDHILLYVEGIRDARRFLSSLRAAARTKPVIAIKVGRHRADAPGLAGRSPVPTGSDRVFAAALRRAGTVQVRTYTQLFAAARILAAAKSCV